jgi:protein-tyrosine phosphatase
MSQTRGSPDPGSPTTYNLLFVCTGNTCRSPMAAAIAGQGAADRGWSHVAVRSAGIAAAAGPASGEAIRAAEQHGLDLSDHRATALTPELVRWADLILVMGPSHLHAVEDLGGEEKVALITSFLEGSAAGQPIEDPFGGDEAAYLYAFRQLEAAIDAVLRRLEPILAP